MLIIITCIFFLTACTYEKESDEFKLFNKYISELKSIEESSVNSPLVININVEKISEDLYIYTALINKNEEKMNDVLALLIHNKESENAFPSVGIFDDKVTITEKEKGIKLSGYVENIEDIIFRLYIEYKAEDNEIVKYYYIYDSTNNLE